FHAFGHDFQPQTVGQGDNGLGDGHVIRMTGDIFYKRFVNFKLYQGTFMREMLAKRFVFRMSDGPISLLPPR
ncbi:hypothetical protein QUF80_21070, partial [Desulfococcaceae bacterium HSG8]|nr:hypothetical protein [Desulfococcaceae bacterium HSG8]